MAVQEVYISVGILGLLSFISLVLCVYVFIAFWDYLKYLFRKIRWKEKDTKLQVIWLYGERRPLIPGRFTSRLIQPFPLDGEVGEDVDNVDCTEEYERNTSSALVHGMTHYSFGKIVFILRYISDREELMVRLLEMEGLPVSQEIYSSDSAYVVVQLKYIGPVEREDKYSQPPKLDICLQEVYYFIISRDQLCFHSLVFQINTFDQLYRRTISGKAEVSLIEGLGSNIFTGNEIVLVREVLPLSQKNSHKDNQEGDPNRGQSPTDSVLSWDYAPTESGTVISSDSGDLPEDIPWHRPYKRIPDDDSDGDFSVTTPSESVMSVESSFHFSKQNISSLSHSGRDANANSFSLMKRSISENILSKFSNLYPPPKDFYRIVPQSPFNAIRSPTQCSTTAKLPGSFNYCETRDSARRVGGYSGLGQSISWPCFNKIREDHSLVCNEGCNHTDSDMRHRFFSASPH